MPRWTHRELAAIDALDEVQLVTQRRDGTFRRPVTVWIVRVGDDLYVRSWRGTDSAWFRAASATERGRLVAGSLTRDVIFRPEDDPARNDAIDRAYRTKYRRAGRQYVEAMVAPRARATTLAVIPAEDPPEEGR